MTRPIKFRGRTKSGKFVFGEYAQNFMGGKPQICYFDEHGWNCTQVDPDSVAQLVGYDKDGNEIYEGDKVVSEYGDEIVARLMDNLPPKAKLQEAEDETD